MIIKCFDKTLEKKHLLAFVNYSNLYVFLLIFANYRLEPFQITIQYLHKTLVVEDFFAFFISSSTAAFVEYKHFVLFQKDCK